MFSVEWVTQVQYRLFSFVYWKCTLCNSSFVLDGHPKTFSSQYFSLFVLLSEKETTEKLRKKSYIHIQSILKQFTRCIQSHSLSVALLSSFCFVLFCFIFIKFLNFLFVLYFLVKFISSVLYLSKH